MTAFLVGLFFGGLGGFVVTALFVMSREEEQHPLEKAYKRGYERGVKEFAERAKKKSKKRVSDIYGARVYIQDIDRIAKEMGVDL